MSSIDDPYAMYAVGMAPAPELGHAARAQVTAVKQAMSPWAASYAYLNFAETQRDPATFWTVEA